MSKYFLFVNTAVGLVLMVPSHTHEQWWSSSGEIYVHESKYKNFHSRKCIWKSCLQNGSYILQGGGITKIVFVNFPILEIFNLIKIC